MKHIYVNFKRFDAVLKLGGINRLAPISKWGAYMVENTQGKLKGYSPEHVEFVQYFPEAHIIPAITALDADSNLKIGCQSVFREDITVGGNFGAFTSNRPAAAMKAVGCKSTIIGHCEERRDKAGVMAEAGLVDSRAVSRLMNKEIKCAQTRGLDVLYCIGESDREQDHWEEVLCEQLDIGLEGVDKTNVVIGYEPIWSIGPGKTPAGSDYITRVAHFIKDCTDGMDVVYGGGLRAGNAEMLASIPEIDGGLIALTRFQGEVGFYPEEYLEIIRIYMGK